MKQIKLSILLIFLTFFSFAYSELSNENNEEVAVRWEEISPRKIPRQDPKIIEEETEDEPQVSIEKDKEITNGKITALLFIPQEDEILEKQKEIKGITIDKGLFVPDKCDFEKIMKTFIGDTISLKILKELVYTVEDYYDRKNYPIVSAKVLPGQDITEGIIKVTVIIARLGEVEAEGAKYFSNKKIAKEITIKPGNYIKADTLMTDLYWINNNPFRTTDLIYERGQELGETDIILQTKDRVPIRPYVAYENTGNKIAGDNRYLAGFNWGKAFGLDQQLNLQYMMAEKPKRFCAVSGSWIVPLPWRNFFKVFGSYVRTKPKMPQELYMTGKSWQLSGRYNIPFFWWEVRHNFTFGYDFKNTNNFLTFITTAIYDKHIDISQFLIGYDGMIKDKYGVSSFGAEIFLSPGNMTPFNTDSAFRIERPGAQADYVYFKFKFDRVTKFPLNFTWVLNTLGQVAGTKLLPSEELSLGGYLTIRGYRENQYIGDMGYMIKNELRTPTIRPSKNKKGAYGEIQFLVFFDYGKLYEIDPNILNRDGTALMSVGPGMRFNYQEHLVMRFDWGFQLDKAHPDSKEDRSRIHFGLTAAY